MSSAEDLKPLWLGALVSVTLVGAGVALSKWAIPVWGSWVPLPFAFCGGALAAYLGGTGASRRLRSRLQTALGRLDESSTDPAFGIEEAVSAVDSACGELRLLHEREARTAERLRPFRTLIGPTDPEHSWLDNSTSLIATLELFCDSSVALARYSGSLTETNDRIASGAVEQRETLARTTSNVEDLSDKIDRISRDAVETVQACERTCHEAQSGREQARVVFEGMDRLQSQIDECARKARRLGERSVEIGTIVDLIRGISSRTDMLALNATIESVRAGDHGRGFAVVAEEIRKLSERTAVATREIGSLVEAIQADTNESIRSLTEERTEMHDESLRIRETAVALERIGEFAERSARLAGGISLSTNEQALAAQALVRGMQQISEISSLAIEHAAQSRESLHALEELADRLRPLTARPSAEVPISSAIQTGDSRVRRPGRVQTSLELTA